ncbi:putative proteasome, subunit alpha/beta, nucleophile aminohydrolase [Rosa chinensis]|uniref:Putative proteasome, subunit alpha/beta, nucleophile aminohydrolase n=1 Tax=Rosa chinensis TaxID=74649 RepID=A0A2P6Q5S1_ROSCH|nr:uncharacterized protein LOC112167987 [Rosa chinensis]PRQ29528.1 putative proteasome, subunit alpha/beta, nucleophile aminohydrolase [Rosa chinensis]
MSKSSSSRRSRGSRSSLLDKQVTGTTTLTLIGEEVIYVVTDERSSTEPPPYMILNDNASKTYAISTNVLATIAGNPDLCSTMLAHVKATVSQELVSDQLDSNNVVHIAANYVHECVTVWERDNPNMHFPSATQIVGWCNGEPSVYGIQCANPPQVTHEHGSGFVHGSGEKSVQDYYKKEDPMPYKRGRPRRSDIELAQIGKRAVVFSALNERYTGGRVCSVEVRPDMIHESGSEEILKVLHDDYDYFKTYLSHFLFCLYRKSDFEYTIDTEAMLSQVIHTRFTSGIQRSHVIQIKEKYFIRILQFPDGEVAKEEFQAVKSEWKQQLGYGHTQDVDVHPHIRSLPWIELHQLQGAPLVFAMATKKYISLFLDL